MHEHGARKISHTNDMLSLLSKTLPASQSYNDAAFPLVREARLGHEQPSLRSHCDLSLGFP